MMKPTYIFILLVALSALSGCADMADSMNEMAGLGVVSEETSTYDGSSTIQVSPNWLYDSKKSWSANSVKLGALWNSATPDLVALDLSYDSSTSGGAVYLGLSGIDINIDGVKSSYYTNSQTSLGRSDYNTVSRTIYTNSNNTVVIPLAVLGKMVNANDCRVRIHTSKGYEDAIFSIDRSDSGQSTALLSIKKFLVKVNAARKPQ